MTRIWEAIVDATRRGFSVRFAPGKIGTIQIELERKSGVRTGRFLGTEPPTSSEAAELLRRFLSERPGS
jgi:hypothetical protein